MSYAACVECGNDDPCEGYDVCSDCLESGAPYTVVQVTPDEPSRG